MDAASRKILIKLAGTLPQGDESRRVILTRLKISSNSKHYLFEALKEEITGFAKNTQVSYGNPKMIMVGFQSNKLPLGDTPEQDKGRYDLIKSSEMRKLSSRIRFILEEYSELIRETVPGFEEKGWVFNFIYLK